METDNKDDGQNQQTDANETKDEQTSEGEAGKQDKQVEPTPEQVVQELRESKPRPSSGHNFDAGLSNLQEKVNKLAESQSKLVERLEKGFAKVQDGKQDDPLDQLLDDDLADGKALKAGLKVLREQLVGENKKISQQFEQFQKQALDQINRMSSTAPQMSDDEILKRVQQHYELEPEYARYVLEETIQELDRDFPHVDANTRSKIGQKLLATNINSLKSELSKRNGKDVSKKDKDEQSDVSVGTKVTHDGASSATTVQPKKETPLTQADAKRNMFRILEKMNK